MRSQGIFGGDHYQGDVSVRDVDPSTMESRKVGGLYFAGEVLDLDALTGGFNLDCLVYRISCRKQRPIGAADGTDGKKDERGRV